MASWDIVPLARSYLQQDWDPTAGPYAASSIVTSCDSTRCTLGIPSLAGTDPTAIFVLTTYDYSSDAQSQVARFLEQATFGPTLDDITGFNYDGDLLTNMAWWVQSQMDPWSVSPTYHREFFRARVDAGMWEDRITQTEKPRHPCRPSARWRRHAFTYSDRQEYINVTTLPDDGRLLISINGMPRTIVDSIQVDTDWDGVYETAVYEGDYRICWGVEEHLGGWLALDLLDGSFNCWGVEGGNPPVYLTEGVMSDYSSVMPVLSLPPIEDFRELDLVLYGYAGPRTFGGAGLIYDYDISDPVCDSLPSGDFSNLMGVFAGGEQAYYDARIELDQNTLESPIFDGGGTTELAGALCSNVPKTFLNLDSCFLSSEPTACSPFRANPTFLLNTDTLSTFYQATGRYVYAIRGLQMTYVPSPCTPYVRHRWKKITSTSCVTSGIDSATNETLTWLITEYGGWDQSDLFTDIHLEWIGDYGRTCNSANTKTIGMKLKVNGQCYQHIHPDEYNVYDFTYWTLPDTHPGNAIAESLGHPPPIKKWAQNNLFELVFPSWHPMDRWENNKELFDYIGRVGNYYEYYDLPSKLRTSALAEALGVTSASGDAVVVCGSPGEVANDPSFNSVFSFADQSGKDETALENQKKNTWNMIALSAADQLRQRMAWALSQILVITPNQINDNSCTEIYLNYYDIFVRHAFGNYRDVLKEVAYSPMMAEMLSFLESKSAAYVLRTTGVRAYPDENFAREVMQLFSIGVHQLNMDGTLKIDPATGLPIPTYQNGDIQTFARAWTGFQRQEQRSNIELGSNWEPNRIDPMRINSWWRDVYPKMDLNDGFIGDAYPLCSDLPDKQFLKQGAKYILLGSSSLPELQTGEPDWWATEQNIVRMALDPTASELYNVLCNADEYGTCHFRPVVVLDSNLNCNGEECNLDNLRAFQVSQDPMVYYEYIRPACVELSFYNGGKKISKTWPYESMCANPSVEEVMDACCPPYDVYWGGAQNLCEFTGERVKYATGASRCTAVHGAQAGVCDWDWLWNNGENNDPNCNLWLEDNWHWTNMTCTLRAKVDETGAVAIVHNPDLSINSRRDEDYIIIADFDPDNTNHFPVKWDAGSFPSVANNCGNGVCGFSADGGCLCDVNVVESRVFSATPTSVDQVVSSLRIGSLHPDWYSSGYTLESSNNGVDVYQRNGGTPFDATTIFGVTVKGKALYFKNLRSMVIVKDPSGKSWFRFRNPPHFLSFIVPDARDAMYETEAVLDHYFYHDNVAPFLATRIIQRFGISDPSPRYVQVVATAFRDGYYTSQDVTFGDGSYGSLAALVSAVLLDPEARSAVLDADPSSGSLREPMIKLIAFLRAMHYESRPDVAEVTLEDLQNTIGQMPHSIPNVFSFFLPDYSFGKIKAASLVAPEAQALTSPTIVGFVNGILSLVDLGLTQCYGGFGELTSWWCPEYDYEWFNKEDYSRGFLRYSPAASSPSEVVDELALLLTSGRLSAASRSLITNEYQSAATAEDGLRSAQKLIATTPEFHSTRVVTPVKVRPNMVTPTPSGNGYKAVVFVMLGGGMDSYNVLVPHSDCPAQDMYAAYSNIRGELALSQSELLTIDASTSSQPCNTFGLHPNLGALQQLYNDGDLAFLANTGVLQQYCTKVDWWQKTSKTSLFAHNTQQDEVSFVDIFDVQAGRGVCGRMTDVLTKNGFKAGTLSVSGVANALVSKLNPLFVLDPSGFEKVNPIPWAEDIVGSIKLLNNANELGSSLFGDAWSNLLFQALGENLLLFDALTSTVLDTEFPDTWLAMQLEAVAKLIKTKDVRGTDRDAFFVEIGGFDTHSNLKATLVDRMGEINGALDPFVQEMKSQGRWDEVVTVFVSEFARTLTPNTSSGSDHAWGGNYFFAGGSINGGQILGQYPSDFTDASDYLFEPGVNIPTTSWDEFWVIIAEWFGITSPADLTEVVPNRAAFSTLSSSLSASDIFKSV